MFFKKNTELFRNSPACFPFTLFQRFPLFLGAAFCAALLLCSCAESYDPTRTPDYSVYRNRETIRETFLVSSGSMHDEQKFPFHVRKALRMLPDDAPRALFDSYDSIFVLRSSFGVGFDEDVIFYDKDGNIAAFQRVFMD